MRIFPFVSSRVDCNPDHDTIANFHKTFLDEIQELFVQILLVAQAAGVLKVGTLSLVGMAGSMAGNCILPVSWLLSGSL